VILLDPPAWPAHGTLWSHLVSDASLHELRQFAQAAGLPDRGFDLDHYDAPAARHDELVAAGATPVDGRTLARRLTASGLRVPGRERATARRPALVERWAALGDLPAEVGADLVTRWAEPHRVYHGRLHLAAALDALDTLLAASDVDPAGARVARLAVWFHDAVHDGEAGRDEERSAALAGEALATAPLTSQDVAEVQRLVLLTAAHDPAPDDRLGGLVSDADLAVLGAAPRQYARYVHQVRAEYGHVPDDAFRVGRAAVLEQLLALPSLYATAAGRARWAAAAEANLRGELENLRG
jgi:predicted metal-dependent HD superfamily phosphohydrolase